MTEEMSVQTVPTNSQWRRRRDVLRQSVSQPPGIKRRPMVERWVRRTATFSNCYYYGKSKSWNSYSAAYVRFFVCKNKTVVQANAELNLIIKGLLSTVVFIGLVLVFLVVVVTVFAVFDVFFQRGF